MKAMTTSYGTIEEPDYDDPEILGKRILKPVTGIGYHDPTACAFSHH